MIIKIILLLCFRVFASEEFENHFLEMVKEKDTKEVEYKVSMAIASIIQRLELPYLDEAQMMQTQGLFDHLVKIVKKGDPSAQIYIAGGVVRSLLGYIYKKIYLVKSKNPKITTLEILNQIILSKKSIPGIAALGVGSDFDILIESSSPLPKTELMDFINSAENWANLRDVKSKLKYNVVPIADVKDYHSQLKRATSQGGSSLDWLAYSLTDNVMRNADNYPDIFKNFFLGEYDYLPPMDKKEIPEEKQTIRGLRPLIEIPFLRLSKNGEVQLKLELDKLITNIKNGGTLANDALLQFEKLMRNAHFEGAHNRFHVVARGKTISTDELESLVYQLSLASKKGDKQLPLVPEFIVNKSLKLRGNKDACGLREAKILMDHEEFLEKYTNHGKLYHGTPSFDNILSVIRNGLYVSDSNQGSAAFNRGAYSTPDKNVAQGYGTPIEFSLKKNVIPRVLDWVKVQEFSQIQKILQMAKEQKMDEFKFLAEKCDVDFIVNQHVLVQNSGALEIPKNVKDLILLYANKIQPPELNELSDKDLISTKLTDFTQSNIDYESFYNLGLAIGIPTSQLPTPIKVTPILRSFLKNKDPWIRKFSAQSLFRILPIEKETFEETLQALKDEKSSIVKLSLAILLGKNFPDSPEVIEILIEFLRTENDTELICTAIECLTGQVYSRPEITQMVIGALKNKSINVKIEAIKALSSQPQQALIHDFLKDILSCTNDNSSILRSLALKFVGNVYNKDMIPQNIKDLCFNLFETDPEMNVKIEAISIIKYFITGENEYEKQWLKNIHKYFSNPNINTSLTLPNIIGDIIDEQNVNDIETIKEIVYQNKYKYSPLFSYSKITEKFIKKNIHLLLDWIDDERIDPLIKSLIFEWSFKIRNQFSEKDKRSIDLKTINALKSNIDIIKKSARSSVLAVNGRYHPQEIDALSDIVFSSIESVDLSLLNILWNIENPTLNVQLGYIKFLKNNIDVNNMTRYFFETLIPTEPIIIEELEQLLKNPDLNIAGIAAQALSNSPEFTIAKKAIDFYIESGFEFIYGKNDLLQEQQKLNILNMLEKREIMQYILQSLQTANHDKHLKIVTFLQYFKNDFDRLLTSKIQRKKLKNLLEVNCEQPSHQVLTNKELNFLVLSLQQAILLEKEKIKSNFAKDF